MAPAAVSRHTPSAAVPRHSHQHPQHAVCHTATVQRTEVQSHDLPHLTGQLALTDRRTHSHTTRNCMHAHAQTFGASLTDMSRPPGVRVLKAPVKALEAPAAQAKAAVQKAAQQPLAPVTQAAQKAASGFDGKKAEVEQAVKQPVAEARASRAGLRCAPPAIGCRPIRPAWTAPRRRRLRTGTRECALLRTRSCCCGRSGV